MFSAGVGVIKNENTTKLLPQEGDKVVRLGGPVYKIGLGGGFNSSIDNNANISDTDRAAAQRGDPQMENKLIELLLGYQKWL